MRFVIPLILLFMTSTLGCICCDGLYDILNAPEITDSIPGAVSDASGTTGSTIPGDIPGNSGTTVPTIPDSGDNSYSESDPCIKYTDIAERDSCYYMEVRQFYNYHFCYNISEDNLRNVCLDYAATLTYDVEYCNEISVDNKKYECIRDRAYTNQDKTLCFTIPDVKYKDECFKWLGKHDPQSCQHISTQTARDSCYFKYAVDYTKDDTYCNNIIDTPTRTSCKEYANK